MSAEKAKTFLSLHVKGDPIVLFNIWDPGSARMVEKAGAKAIATGSWPVAVAHGYADGENMPLDMAIDNLRRIVSSVQVPVSVDLEGGYGAEPETVAATVERALAAGAVGFNFEDQTIGGEGLYPVAKQAARVGAARAAADAAGIPAFLNARTDLFLKSDPAGHNGEMLEEALERCRAYAEAGASGFFAPGLADPDLIGGLCDASPLPVNILARAGVPDKDGLAKLGVARISHGPGPYRLAMAALSEAAQNALG